MLLIEYLTNVVSDVLYDSLKDKKQTAQLHSKIKERVQRYLERHKNENGRYSLQSEYDYEGLYSFCNDCLLSDMREYIKAPGNKREEIKKRIKEKAINASQAEYHLAEFNVSQHVEELIKMIYAIYRDAADVETLLLTGEIEERMDENTNRIIAELNNADKKVQLQHKEEITELIETRRKWVLSQVLFPWFHDSKKYYEVFPQLFVKPIFHKNDNPVEYNTFISSAPSCIAILGNAGAGKSTLLRYIFAFSKLPNIESVYFTAKEIKESFSCLEQLSIYSTSFKKPIIVMIDGIDEAFHNNYKDFERFTIALKSFHRLFFWLGCRTDFYRTYFNDQLSFIEHNYSIDPWKEKQIEFFINEYSKISEVSNIPDIIDQLIGTDENLKEIKKNPFHLALLVYLAENNEDESISGIYNLYERFFQKWLQNENKRGTSPDDKAEIIKSLKNAAQIIYDGGKWEFDCIAMNNSAVRDLLTYEEKDSAGNLYATGFYHLSLATFLLAESVFETFEKRNCTEIVQLLSHKLKDDVTNFIGDKFAHLTKTEKTALYNNMKYAYSSIRWSDSTLSVHEQIIYFVTRLGIDVSDFLLSVINNKRQSSHPIMRLTLAYGCVLSEHEKVRKFALEYARSIANDSIDASVNRGWTVVYFGDVPDKDPYSYLDDEQRSWTKARNARIKRFTKKHPRKKDVRFWLFDIPLFYSFLNNRGWTELSEDDYKILKSLSFTSEYFNDAEIDFLSDAHSKLLSEYSNHLKNQCDK